MVPCIVLANLVYLDVEVCGVVVADEEALLSGEQLRIVSLDARVDRGDVEQDGQQQDRVAPRVHHAPHKVLVYVWT